MNEDNEPFKVVKKTIKEKKNDEMESRHQTAIRKVQWALSQSYKIAVHNAGVTDWSKETELRKRQVEIDQLKITKMLLREVNLELDKK